MAKWSRYFRHSLK